MQNEKNGKRITKPNSHQNVAQTICILLKNFERLDSCLLNKMLVLLKDININILRF
jgi:hypothetical protein